MLHIIIFFFLIVGFIGLFLINAILKGGKAPRSVAMIHGSLAVIAVLMFIVFTITRPISYLRGISLGLFILAALGGITLFIMDVNKKPAPKAIILIHPLIALTALVLLIVSLFV